MHSRFRRFRTSLLFALVIVSLYVFWLFRKGDANLNLIPDLPKAGDSKEPASKEEHGDIQPTPAAEPSGGAWTGGPITQENFNRQSDALGEARSAGEIYGSTLGRIIDVGKHAGFNFAALTKTEGWTAYHDAPPFEYNPYPDYNNKPWNTTNKGTYVPCDGPHGKFGNIFVFSGHPKAFGTAPLGSWVPLDVDSNLCYERKTRLGPYGYIEDGVAGLPTFDTRDVSEDIDWDTVNWGQMQEFCAAKNADRYVKLEEMPHISSRNKPRVLDPFNGVVNASTPDIKGEGEGRKQEKKPGIKAKSRTALLLRAGESTNYTENLRQNIRSLVTELSLRSGAEYQVYLLTQAAEESIPKEFQDMAIQWTDAITQEWYPKVPKETSEWLPVQKFAQEHPQFDYYWNWEVDSRYTGHHYDLLEKLASFAAKQPRKGLWERNERFFVASRYAEYYNTHYRTAVEHEMGSAAVWGNEVVANTTAVGPEPPTSYEEDRYKWGVGEEADFISLSPMFNPIGTDWVGKDDVWGYSGLNTPRRATFSVQSRLSKKLLDQMHKENQNGNHLGSEMAPQTVSLLHGFKAVYAPIPIYFDREWDGQSLEKWFNPGPNGESGSCKQSPFGKGLEGRFAGSTWYTKAVPAMRLYNNWMGWEDSGIGGTEWEKQHGRACLPPMLLHPVKDVVKPPPDHSSESVPYGR